MFVAIMNRECFEWVGMGKTENAAKRAIHKKWNEDDRREKMTLAELEDWYGFHVYELNAGEADYC